MGKNIYIVGKERIYKVIRKVSILSIEGIMRT
jgi:hypothetical protein